MPQGRSEVGASRASCGEQARWAPAWMQGGHWAQRAVLDAWPVRPAPLPGSTTPTRPPVTLPSECPSVVLGELGKAALAPPISPPSGPAGPPAAPPAQGSAPTQPAPRVPSHRPPDTHAVATPWRQPHTSPHGLPGSEEHMGAGEAPPAPTATGVLSRDPRQQPVRRDVCSCGRPCVPNAAGAQDGQRGSVGGAALSPLGGEDPGLTRWREELGDAKRPARVWGACPPALPHCSSGGPCRRRAQTPCPASGGPAPTRLVRAPLRWPSRSRQLRGHRPLASSLGQHLGSPPASVQPLPSPQTWPRPCPVPRKRPRTLTEGGPHAGGVSAVARCSPPVCLSSSLLLLLFF